MIIGEKIQVKRYFKDVNINYPNFKFQKISSKYEDIEYI